MHWRIDFSGSCWRLWRVREWTVHVYHGNEAAAAILLDWDFFFFLFIFKRETIQLALFHLNQLHRLPPTSHAVISPVGYWIANQQPLGILHNNSVRLTFDELNRSDRLLCARRYQTIYAESLSLLSSSIRVKPSSSATWSGEAANDRN